MRNDWSIREDGQEISRLYEDPTATRPENAWFWSIIVMGPGPTDGWPCKGAFLEA
jgi:hypothetical protein